MKRGLYLVLGLLVVFLVSFASCEEFNMESFGNIKPSGDLTGKWFRDLTYVNDGKCTPADLDYTRFNWNLGSEIGPYFEMNFHKKICSDESYLRVYTHFRCKDCGWNGYKDKSCEPYREWEIPQSCKNYGEDYKMRFYNLYCGGNEDCQEKYFEGFKAECFDGINWVKIGEMNTWNIEEINVVEVFTESVDFNCERHIQDGEIVNVERKAERIGDISYSGDITRFEWRGAEAIDDDSCSGHGIGKYTENPQVTDGKGEYVNLDFEKGGLDSARVEVYIYGDCIGNDIYPKGNPSINEMLPQECFDAFNDKYSLRVYSGNCHNRYGSEIDECKSNQFEGIKLECYNGNSWVNVKEIHMSEHGLRNGAIHEIDVYELGEEIYEEEVREWDYFNCENGDLNGDGEISIEDYSIISNGIRNIRWNDVNSVTGNLRLFYEYVVNEEGGSVKQGLAESLRRIIENDICGAENSVVYFRCGEGDLNGDGFTNTDDLVTLQGAYMETLRGKSNQEINMDNNLGFIDKLISRGKNYVTKNQKEYLENKINLCYHLKESSCLNADMNCDGNISEEDKNLFEGILNENNQCNLFSSLQTRIRDNNYYLDIIGNPEEDPNQEDEGDEPDPGLDQPQEDEPITTNEWRETRNFFLKGGKDYTGRKNAGCSKDNFVSGKLESGKYKFVYSGGAWSAWQFDSPDVTQRYGGAWLSTINLEYKNRKGNWVTIDKKSGSDCLGKKLDTKSDEFYESKSEVESNIIADEIIIEVGESIEDNFKIYLPGDCNDDRGGVSLKLFREEEILLMSPVEELTELNALYNRLYQDCAVELREGECYCFGCNERNKIEEGDKIVIEGLENYCEGGELKSVKLVEESCEENYECASDLSCSSTKGYCVQVVGSGRLCGSISECEEGLFCEMGICKREQVSWWRFPIEFFKGIFS